MTEWGFDPRTNGKVMCQAENHSREGGLLPALRTDPFSVLFFFPETFFVLASHLESATVDKGNPIFLAASKGEFCLHCDKDKGKSQLSLQLKVSILAQFPIY
jgi:hypothetical protein